MNKLTTILFPDTTASTETIGRELFFFERILFYQPVEVEQERNDSPAAERPCAGYCPAPLGDDLERFSLLLKELKGHETEFYNGLMSSMSLEYRENRGRETTLDLIMSMRGKSVTGPETEMSEEGKILWNSRLLLKLAEMRRQEDNELDMALSSVAEKQLKLFRELKGAEERDEFEPPVGIKPAPVKIAPLLKAWGRLFLADREPAWILTTTNKEAAEILLDLDDTGSGQAPGSICRLVLPDVDPAKFSWSRENFRKEVAETIAELGSLLRKAADDGPADTTCRKLEAAAAEWDKGLKALGLTTGKTALEFYCCGSSLAHLMARLCKTANNRPTSCPAHGLLAVEIKKS